MKAIASDEDAKMGRSQWEYPVLDTRPRLHLGIGNTWRTFMHMRGARARRPREDGMAPSSALRFHDALWAGPHAQRA